MNHHKPCPTCGKQTWYTSKLCRKCTAQLRQHPNVIDKFHKPCPACGNPMYRYSKTCFTCAGKVHNPTPERRKDQIRRKNQKAHVRHRTERIQRSRDYYAKNRERLLQKAKEYRLAHPEQIREAAKRWRTEHLDKAKICDREYQRSHAEARKSYLRDYRQRNPELVRQQRLAYYRSEKGKAYFMNARKRHQDSPQLKENKYHLLWIEYRPCEICGSYSQREVDHIIEQSKGGTDEIDNVRVLCFTHHRKSGNGRHSVWREGE